MATYRNKKTGEVITLSPEQESQFFRNKVLQLSAGQQEGAFGTVATFKGADDLVAILDKGLKTGPISGSSQRIGQITSGQNEDFNQFRSGVTQLTANFIKALSGVQVSDKERRFLMGVLPSPYKQEQVNRDGIKTLLTFLKDKYETQLGVKFENLPNVVPLTALGEERIRGRQDRIENLREEASAAQIEAQKGLGRRFLEELPGQTAKQLLQQPARFVASGALSPIDIGRGVVGAKPLDVNIPGVGKTFQAQAQERLDQGASPVGTIGRALFEVPLAGLETIGIGKGVSIGIRGTKRLFEGRRTAKDIQHAVEAVAPALGKKDKISAFAQAGKPGGVVRGRFGAVNRTPSKEDVEIAKAAAPFVKGNDPIKHVENLGTEIVRHSDDSIRPYLRANPRAYNTATLNAHLTKIDAPDWIKADATAERTYNLVRQRLIDAVEQHPKTMEGLWDSRISFDQIVKQQFGDAALDPNKRAFVNRAIRDMRQGVHSFIEQQTGDSQFKQSMKYLSRLYRAIDNISDKNYRTVEAVPPVKKLFGNLGRRAAEGAVIGTTAGVIGGAASGAIGGR